jgi:DNA uptake protein ComE-like DNA-binding protein
MAVSTPLVRKSHWTDRGLLRWLRHYLGYSRAEMRGMVVILLLMLGMLFVPMLVKPQLVSYLPAADQQGLDKLVATLHEHRVSNAAFAARYPRRGTPPAPYPAGARVALAPFDPNALTAAGWEARGVPHFVAARLVKYQQAAGGFKAKAQIKRMYGLDDSVYQRLAPFVQLPAEMPRYGERPAFARHGSAYQQDGPGKYPRKPRNLQPFDLNRADTTQLMQIRGIGRWKALAVVKERNLLGGFINEKQLETIYSFREAPDLVDSLRKYTFVATGFAPQLVPLNTATFDEMCFHPYIRKPLARAIVAYRNQHGPFKTVDDLKQIAFLKAEDLEKLRPYVRCE